jgi:acetyl esterase/lipase
MMRRLFVLQARFVGFVASAAVLMLCVSHIQAAGPRSLDVPLWSNGAPNALGKEAKDTPMAFVRLPESDQPTSALVILPGGGYGNLAMGHEGKDIAEWANSMGMAAVICDYRHKGKGYAHPAPMQDAQRAIRLARANAKDWNIDPSRVGVIGFSAGGHLASTVLTKFEAADATQSDPVARESSRPDFGILAYPVIVFGQDATHKGSQRNLLGESPSQEMIALFSSEKQVTKETPPTFLFHTMEDKGVPPENSIAFYSAMLRNGVPGELHVFEKGKHGIGLGKSIPVTSEWSLACHRWLVSRGFALPTKPKAD